MTSMDLTTVNNLEKELLEVLTAEIPFLDKFLNDAKNEYDAAKQACDNRSVGGKSAIEREHERIQAEVAEAFYEGRYKFQKGYKLGFEAAIRCIKDRIALCREFNCEEPDLDDEPLEVSA